MSKNTNVTFWFKLSDLFITVLLIPPPCIRPITLVNYRNSIEYDALNVILGNIIGTNIKLKESCKYLTPILLRDSITRLQNLIDDYYIGEDKRLPSGAKLTSLKGTIKNTKSKRSLYRLYIAGSRRNNTARTVITGDINIKLNEVGIPAQLARTLFKTVIIDRINISMYQKIIREN